VVDRLEFRVNKLARMSGHYRELAAALFPENVSAEIEAVADAFDDELLRMDRECVGQRACPCEFSGACVALADVGSDLDAPTRPAQGQRRGN
jgi:hypothetical protein